MRNKATINEFLPVAIRPGQVVRHFSKPCVRCGHTLQAANMVGIVRLIDAHLALSAEAHCPSCQQRFGVSCVITADKKVRRVALPAWLFGLYLRTLPTQPGESPWPSGSAERSAPVDLSKPASPSQLAVQGPSHAAGAPRDEPAALSSPVEVGGAPAQPSAQIIGQYQGRPIPASITVGGRVLAFDHVSLNGKADPGEVLYDSTFVYK